MISDALLPEPNRTLRVSARAVAWPLSVLGVAAGSLWRVVVMVAVPLGVPVLAVLSFFGWRWLFGFVAARTQASAPISLALLATWILPLLAVGTGTGAVVLARSHRRGLLEGGPATLGIGALLLATVGCLLGVHAFGSLSIQSASWLPWVVLATQVLAGVAVGALVAAIWLAIRIATGALRPLPAIVAGARSWRAHVVQGGKYLAFVSNEFPRLDGSLRKPEESHGPWHEARRRLGRSKVALIAWIGVAIYLMVGILAQGEWIGAGFRVADKEAVYVAPGGTSVSKDPTTGETIEKHWFLGTDYIGHSVGAMVLRGTAVALWIGIFAAVLACVIGSVLGALAGYFGGWVDELIVWLYTTLESIPEMLLILAFAFAFKTNEDIRDAYNGSFLAGWGLSLGLFTIVLVIGLTFWTGVCRQVRGEFIRQRDLDYVTAARALGVPTSRIVFRHVFPNVFHLVLISFSLLFIGAIKYEVVLTFLGVGVEPGESSWGQMITGAKLELLREPSVWWQLTAATAMLFGLVLCVNLFTDALRDALDPRTRT